MTEKRSFEKLAEQMNMILTYSLLVIDRRNGDSDMITNDQTEEEVREMLLRPEWRTFTVVGIPSIRVADSDSTIEFKVGTLNKIEKVEKLLQLLRGK